MSFVIEIKAFSMIYSQFEVKALLIILNVNFPILGKR